MEINKLKRWIIIDKLSAEQLHKLIILAKFAGVSTNFYNLLDERKMSAPVSYYNEGLIPWVLQEPMVNAPHITLYQAVEFMVNKIKNRKIH